MRAHNHKTTGGTIMSHLKKIPCALTIGGSDSGGGAGIQADLKVFAAYGVHGASAITCITAQNPRAVTGFQPAGPGIVRAQIMAVESELRPAAVKTGMLYSKRAILEVMTWRRSGSSELPLVVDPVMIATSGAKLLRPSAYLPMLELFRLSTLVMPNVPEAEFIVGMPLGDVENLRSAARLIHRQFGCAALVKGGHLKGLREAVDVFCDGKVELLLTAPYVRGVSTHGTGCTYSAAVTAGLALGLSLEKSVVRAKEFISNAISQSRGVARHSVLNCFWR